MNNQESSDDSQNSNLSNRQDVCKECNGTGHSKRFSKNKNKWPCVQCRGTGKVKNES